MSKHTIYLLIGFVAAGALLAAGYQFFFVDLIDGYRKDEARRDVAAAKIQSLATTFSKTKPAVIIDAYENAAAPWAAAVDGRFRYFGIKGFDVEIEPFPPAKVPLAAFYYRNQHDRIQGEFQKYLYEHPYLRLPGRLPGLELAGAPGPEEIARTRASVEQIQACLYQLELTASILEMLVEKTKAVAIAQVQIWGLRTEGNVAKRTVGVEMYIQMADLVQFLSEVERSETYFSVDAIEITNPALTIFPPPPVHVQMLLTQAALI